MKPFDYQSKIQDLKLSILRSEAFELKNNPMNTLPLISCVKKWQNYHL